MGVLIPVGEGQVAVHLRNAASSKDCVWTMGYVNPTDEPPENTASGFAGSLNAAGCPYQASKMGTDWVFLKVVATLMTSTGPLSGEYSAAIVGTLSQDTPSLNLSMLAKKITARGGRSGRGRAYLPIVGIDESDIDSMGYIGPSVYSAQKALWDTWLPSLDSVDIVPVLHHEAGGAGDPIRSFILEDQCATQRRRMR